MDTNRYYSISKGDVSTPTELKLQQTGSWCHTHIKRLKFSHTWRINNFSLRTEKVGECLISSAFSISLNAEPEWRLLLYPKGLNQESEECLSLYLELISCSYSPDVKASYKFCILDSRGDQRNQMESCSFRKFLVGQKRGFSEFVNQDYLMDKANGLLHDDNLAIVCEITAIGRTLNVSGYDSNVMPSSFSDQVIRTNLSFENLLNSSAISDVILCSEGREFPAHAAILASGSPVFHEMLRTGMVEADGKTRRLEVSDFSWDVVMKMLQFIYTGKVSDLDEMAEQLLAASNKYVIPGLKVICEDSLTTKLSLDNFPDLLILADAHNAERLKENVKRFINYNNVSDIDGSTNWREMAKSHPRLFAESLGFVPGIGVADRSDLSPSTAVNALDSKPDPQTVTCVHSWMSKANDSNRMQSRNWCETNMNTLGFTIRWTIANFSCCHLELGAYLESPTFTSGPTDSRKWCLEFYPKSSEENEDTVALFLNHVEEPNPDAPDVQAKFKACILDGNEEKKYERGGVALRNYSECSWGFNEFLARDVLTNKDNKLINNDRLVILCEVDILEDTVNQSDRKSLPEVPNSYLELGRLLESSEFSDVDLRVEGGEDIRAHKAVLASSSPVFRAMFEIDMEERKLSLVKINDIQYEVLKEMLRFIYTGEARNLDKMADRLLCAADKYAVAGLKQMCEMVLASNLSLANCIEILVLADLHSADLLLRLAISFIKSHVFDVIETPEWKEVIETHPHLVAETIHMLASLQYTPSNTS